MCVIRCVRFSVSICGGICVFLVFVSCVCESMGLCDCVSMSVYICICIYMHEGFYVRLCLLFCV